MDESHDVIRDARHIKWGINEPKIREQIREVMGLPDWKMPTGYFIDSSLKSEKESVDPREKYNLDTTKVFLPEHRERLKAWMNGERVAPITMDMALTQKCTFSCTYCYAGLQFNRESPGEWDKYSGLIDDMVTIGHKPGEGVKAVSLVSDGESTESPYFYDFIRYAKSRGIDMAVGTNGYKLEPSKMHQLMKDLTYLRFNISAGEKERYKEIMGVGDKQWEQSIENIREAVRLKKENNLETTIGLQMVLLPHYADQVIPLALLTKELGADYLVIKHCSDDEKGSLGVDYRWYHTPLAQDILIAAEGLSDEKTSIQAKWSKIKTGRDRSYDRCYGPALMLQISGSGIVAPCGSFFGPGYEKYQIGNFLEKPFREIWESERYWEVINGLHGDPRKFNPKNMCATLCLQDKVNEALYDVMQGRRSMPEVNSMKSSMHRNFI